MPQFTKIYMTLIHIDKDSELEWFTNILSVEVATGAIARRRNSLLDNISFLRVNALII